MAPASRDQRHRRRLGGGLRVGRGLQSRVRPRLRPPAEREHRELLGYAAPLPAAEWHLVRSAGHQLLEWEGAEETLAAILERAVFAKEVWLAAIEGTDHPDVDRTPDPAALLARAWLRAAGADLGDGDPISWLRRPAPTQPTDPQEDR